MKTITFDQLRWPVNWMLEDCPSMSEVKDLVIDILQSPEDYKAVLSKNMKVADLKKALTWPRGNKGEMIDQLLRVLVNTLAHVKSLQYGFGKGEYEKALMKHVEEVFVEERWEKEINELRAETEARRARMKEKIAGLDDPKTLEDFENIVRIRGQESLNDWQLKEYDSLRVARDKEARVRNLAMYSHRYAIDLDGIAFDLIDTKHTQKGHDLFVVQFSEWLPRRMWRKAFERAKEFGGWYSSYDKGGAITGIQFASDSQRKGYCESVLCGGAQLADHITEVKYLATLNASARLKRLADNMTNQAAVDLENANAAKSNTPRRAAHQASAIERANAKAALAATMRNVAELIGDDPDHILAGIKYRVDFDTLRAVGTKYPEYRVNRELGARLLKECGQKEAKLAFGMLRKRLREAKEDTIRLNDKIVEQFMNKGVEAWWLFEQYTHRSRLKRMGLSRPWELRHAQGLLAEITEAPGVEPEWKTAERDLVGMNIPGFFPTPPALIRAMCDAVDLKATDVVFDPSCGKGDILLYAVEHYNVEGALGSEINPRLAALCKLRGLEHVTCKDTLDGRYPYDRVNVILMNPPFETGLAVDHFNHAWQQASSGTRIAAILPSSVVSREDGKHQAFRTLVERDGGEITHNPEGSFKSAFRSTDVSTVMLVITKE